MKVTLLLLGEKGLVALESLDRGALASIEKVIIGTDKNVRTDYSKEILLCCQREQIPWTHDDKMVSTPYVIAIGWRKMIPVRNDQKLIVLHDSLLPRYRGFNPLVTALINGDKTIGVTALFGNNEYDKGAIIAQEELRITYPITIQQAISKIAVCYAGLLQIIFQKINTDTLTAVPQDEALATYSLWRDYDDYFIDWGMSAEKIARFINAVGDPYEGAKFLLADKVYTVLEAHETTDVTIENRTPGKVIFKQDDKILVVCQKGIICLDKVIDSNNIVQKFTSKFRLRLK